MKPLLLAVLGMAFCSVSPANAQRVRGQVVLPDGATPAVGVVIVATGDSGALVRRALTSDGGAFDLQMAHGGRFELRVLRIGFQPTVVENVELAAGEVRSLRIVLKGDPVALPRVAVRGRDLCRSTTGGGLLVARVWESARTALMASQLAAEQPLMAEWIQFDRTLDATGTRVRGQTVRTTRSPTTHAFKSRPADSLAADGYIVSDNAATTFYAPDADVLLSDSFASGHCFHVEPPPAGRADLIGVGFAPARDRGDAKDIEGTLWLDRTSAELRWIEYRYTNVPEAAERADAGGRVEFLRLPTGEWLVSRWSIRMPRIGVPEQRPGDGMERVLLASPAAALMAVQITGGEVTRVWRGDSAVYRAAGAAFGAQVVSRDSLVPAAQARVALIGTDYAAAADDAGRARISPVLEGKYRVRVTSPLMDTLGAAPVERDVDIRADRAHIDSLSLPTATALLRAACGRDAVSNNVSLLRGIVRDSLGHGTPHAAVTLTFQTDANKTATASGADGLSWSEQTLGSLTDDSGRWRLCGVPRGKVLTVRTETDAGADAKRIRVDDADPIAAVDLTLHSKGAVIASLAGAIVAGSVAPEATALVEISVSTRAGVPVADAIVELTPHGGRSRSVRTLANGYALVPAVEPGLVRVRARHIGLKAGDLSVRIEAGRNTVPILLDEARNPALDTVRVMGNKRVLARYEEFESRLLNHEATASFTEEDIKKQNPTQAWQMLTSISAIDVSDREEDGNLMVVASSRRSMITSVIGNGGNQPCFLKVMIDGVLLPADDITGRTNLDHLPPPESIHGIEVFGGPASIPLQYSGAGAGKWCGLIAVWTK